VGEVEAGIDLATGCLDGGGALRRWESMLAAQGAELAAYREKLRRDSTAVSMREVAALRKGFVAGIDARVIGEVVRDLGAGRLTKGARVDPEVGIDRLAVVGEGVVSGRAIARIHAGSEAAAAEAAERVGAAFRYADSMDSTG